MACFCIKKKKINKAPSVDHIISDLESTEAILVKQTEEVEKQIEDSINIAKLHATSNKRMAMRALQKKKRLEKNLKQIDSTLTTLEIQKDALHSAKTNAVVLESIKNAGEAIRKANIKLDSNKVQNLMENISEQHEVGNEISTTIRNSLVSEVDDDELAKELAQLQEVELNQKMIGVSIRTKLPPILLELDEKESASKQDEINPDKNEPNKELYGPCSST